MNKGYVINTDVFYQTKKGAWPDVDDDMYTGWEEGVDNAVIYKTRAAAQSEIDKAAKAGRIDPRNYDVEEVEMLPGDKYSESGETMNISQRTLNLVSELSTEEGNQSYSGFKIKTYQDDGKWYADTYSKNGDLEGTVGPVNSEDKAVSMSKKEIDNLLKSQEQEEDTDLVKSVQKLWAAGKSLAEIEKSLGVKIEVEGGISDQHKNIMDGKFTVSQGEGKAIAWDVFLDGKLIDTVFSDETDAAAMKKSLVDHDNYDSNIEVKVAEDANLDKVYAEILKDFDELTKKVKAYVDGIPGRRSSKNIDDMIGNVADSLEKFAQDYRNL
jgi:hypothetical protein